MLITIQYHGDRVCADGKINEGPVFYFTFRREKKIKLCSHISVGNPAYITFIKLFTSRRSRLVNSGEGMFLHR